MTFCFHHNINCLYLPAHTSHGLQALDNAPFASLKRAYESEIEKLNSFTDGSPIGKLNFIRCIKTAREAVSQRTIIKGFSHTGTWPVSRAKALRHPEIGEDSVDPPEVCEAEEDLKDEVMDHGYIMGLADPQDHAQRLTARKIATEFDSLRARIALLERENTGLQMKVKELTKTKKKRPVPNPNKRFIAIAEIGQSGGFIEDLEEERPAPKRRKKEPEIIVVDKSEEEMVETSEDEEDDEVVEVQPEIRTRSGRTVVQNSRYLD